MKYRVRCSAAALSLLLTLSQVAVLAQKDALKNGFLNPPPEAKPRVWWHWMDGNVTKEGIRSDLEWMQRIGIGGFHQFDVGRLFTPKLVTNRLTYMSPEWKDAFRFAASEADRLGMEMTTHSSPGWSVSGGPWVQAAESMKKFVWSETPINGGQPFTGKLSQPPAVAGPFQNIKVVSESQTAKPDYYADSAVFAYRIPENALTIRELAPKVSSTIGDISLAVLTDGDFEAATSLPKAQINEKSWIQFEFAEPQQIFGFTLGLKGVVRDPLRAAGNSGQQLEVSEDGKRFEPIATAPTTGAVVNTVSFPSKTARYFRFTFQSLPDPPPLYEIPGVKPPPPATSFDITELVLHTTPRINRYEEKAAFGLLPTLTDHPTAAVSPSAVVDKANVVDLTSRLRPDGSLTWTPPSGKWMVVRFGYSLTGAENKPAPLEATGLEVDKLSRVHVRNYLESYLGKLKDTLGPLLGRRGLQNLLTDSWEAGPQNWTEEMISEFSRRRGYDMRPWLPVLTGRVVESSEASDRFLWDYRRTIADLVAENHFDQIAEISRQYGLGRYVESHEGGRQFVGDGMEVKRRATVPMGATWIPAPRFPATQYEADVRESASVAHLYGQNLVAAESLTVSGFGDKAFKWSPETLKPTADQELASGLNRFVIHTSVHQPLTGKAPGVTLGPVGQWFTRNETWADLAKPWVSYLSRSSYLLQQGKFVADVLYFYGEDSNITALFGQRPPPIPAGYNYDYVNADALINQITVKDGNLVTPGGMSYRVLVLDPNSKHMSLPVLIKLRDLVNGGALVIGSKPLSTPSLSDDVEEFQSIANSIWNVDPTRPQRVLPTQTIDDALKAIGIVPDFQPSNPQSDSRIRFVHRRVEDGEIYWVNNWSDSAEEVEATFRTTGREAELWHPETGKIEKLSYSMLGDDRTTVTLRLNPNEAVFVVFRKRTSARTRNIRRPKETFLAAVDGSWSVRFQPDRGAPAEVKFESLTSWTENSDPGVKYFSGTATYSKQLRVPREWLSNGARVWLDLGSVKELASVSVNGKPLEIIWKKPFRVDITGAVTAGENSLEVSVTNLWVNRSIGDLQPGVQKKYTFTTWPYFRPDSALMPSGLLGPVRLIRIEQ